MSDTLNVTEIPEGGECPDLDLIADDLRALAHMVTVTYTPHGQATLDVPQILRDLAEAVDRWHAAVEG